MKGLKRRLEAIEVASAGEYWKHEDWVAYFDKKARGEDVSHITPRPSPALLALLAEQGRNDE